MKELNLEDVSYIAGYLDGEGCFTVGANSKIVISCENTHRETIEWIHRCLGGSFCSITNKKKLNHRPTYRWQVVGRQAQAVCELLTVHLREKQEQAALLLAIRQLMGLPLIGRKLQPAVYEERLRLAVMVKEKKGRIRGST